MSKAPSSQRAGDDLQDSTSTVGASKLQKSQGDSETHIQVILRCRGRSEREMQANSPSIVTIGSAKAKDLTIETSTPISSLGMVTLPPTRTYPFDLVFGPEATQSMIYHDVVGPMLNEVMLGYNCTLFAYGQTGTGKTYTMQGDLCPTPMGNPSAHAGIIPRVLFRLFHELEKAYTDFIVKVSFIELYNEELRDLLASDLSAPTTLIQPMGMAAKDSKAAEGGLKIFDDASKRGVFIQGLEEIAVKDSKDALALLMKGSERRQIAATKFNDHSSRSHSVFSITVHIKEMTTMGDDLLKVGKLNLVDLAGSENIGRSGAENKRAREAGMINQSLLTLGRVINALVDKASHVPYRESKLTRLLQDSLGGRTKTCIIATISPARSNLEETLSTLDYALRAKSIRNKPELNQRMTRNSLLKEYVVEIERLKADLLAAREKNGIYFSEETWNQLSAENELKETELVEAKKQVEIIENQMRNVRDEYDQSIALLKRREDEIQLMKGKLEETERTLRQRETDLQQAVNAYEQEVVIRQAHQDTELNLNGVAVGLKNVAAQSLRDINGLFEKLDRKNKVLVLNNRVVSENERLIHAFTDSLTQKLAEFCQLSYERRASLENETKKFRSSDQQTIATHIQKVEQYFDRAQELFQQIECNGVVEGNTLDAVKHEIEAVRKSFEAEISSWSEGFESTFNQLCEQSTSANINQVNILEQSASILYSLVEAISREVHTYLADERDALTQMQTLANTLAGKEVAHLKRQNELLAHMLVSERENAEKAKGELLQRVSAMLGEFMQQRDNHLKESIGNLQHSNKEVEDLLASTYQQQTKAHDGMAVRNGELGLRLNDVTIQGVEMNTNAAQRTAAGGMEEMQNAVANSVASHSKWVHHRTHAMEKSSNNAFEEHSRAKRARLDATGAIFVGIRSQHTIHQNLLGLTSKQTERYASQTLSWLTEQGQDTQCYEEAATKSLESIEHAASDLASKGIKDDTPSGNTPRKRKWRYDDEWTLTRSRDDLLKNWKQPETLTIDGRCSRENPTELIDSSMAVPTSHRQSETGTGSKHVTKAEATKLDVPAAEPLIESRRRNVSTVRASSRRVR
ncbi:P-loop containing nucleoside triphosphate hydrolase protein [Flammula alnicola]|nr:P-loop containing nucleoside triphosphate hydrolase protein [Flammula alnicola]